MRDAQKQTARVRIPTIKTIYIHSGTVIGTAMVANPLSYVKRSPSPSRIRTESFYADRKCLSRRKTGCAAHESVCCIIDRCVGFRCRGAWSVGNWLDRKTVPGKRVHLLLSLSPPIASSPFSELSFASGSRGIEFHAEQRSSHD